ncbi:MAG: hypothetical protein GY842_10755 [bacterium]|nr:hypothetical protein [bacterium]
MQDAIVIFAVALAVLYIAYRTWGIVRRPESGCGCHRAGSCAAKSPNANEPVTRELVQLQVDKTAKHDSR